MTTGTATRTQGAWKPLGGNAAQSIMATPVRTRADAHEAQGRGVQPEAQAPGRTRLLDFLADQVGIGLDMVAEQLRLGGDQAKKRVDHRAAPAGLSRATNG